MYRPEGWVNPWEVIDDTSPPKYINALLITCFEAGADAMLEGLKKGVDRPYPNVSYPFRTVVAMQKGIVVFIPDEDNMESVPKAVGDFLKYIKMSLFKELPEEIARIKQDIRERDGH